MQRCGIDSPQSRRSHDVDYFLVRELPDRARGVALGSEIPPLHRV
jgi:hypothetical protein